MEKKKIAVICLAAFLVLGGISAYAYREVFIIALDAARDGDADQDTMPTRYEEEHGLNPLRDDRYEDLDADAKFNIDEYREGLLPENPDHDGDHIADGIDRAPKNSNALPLRETFDPGLLWAHIPLHLTRLECESRSALRVFDLGGWSHGNCIESPPATGHHAAALHPVTNTPWYYTNIDAGGERVANIGSKVYPGKDGVVHYEIHYTGVKERFYAGIANNAPAQLDDPNDVPYRYTTFDISIPAKAAEHVTFELQGYSGNDKPLAFDVRYYDDHTYEPGVYEDRFIVMAQRTQGGAFQADIPLPRTLPAGEHVLFLMPFLVDAELKKPSAPSDFAIHNANQRILERVIINATSSDSPLLDGVPDGALGVAASSQEGLAAGLDTSGIDLEGWNKAATLVESFAVIGVIPDAKVRASAEAGHPESARLAGAKGIVVTHEQGGKYHVTTRSAALVNNEKGLHLVTRSTTESFTKLPLRYAEYAGKGIVESSAHAVAVATELGADAQVITRRAEAETIGAGLDKIRAGAGGTRTVLDEIDPKAGFAKAAFRIAGAGLIIFDIIAMDQHWEEATSAADLGEAAKAWGLFIARGISAAAIVLPLSPFAIALAAIIAIAAESLLDPAFYTQVLDKTTGALQALAGRIPDSDQRAAFVQATRDFESLARAHNAPLFVGQVDEAGNSVTPAAFALPREKVGWFMPLVIVGLIALAGLAALGRR